MREFDADAMLSSNANASREVGPAPGHDHHIPGNGLLDHLAQHGVGISQSIMADMRHHLGSDRDLVAHFDQLQYNAEK